MGIGQLNAPFPTMVDTEDTGRTVKTAITMAHVKVVIHEINAVKNPIDGHKAIAAGGVHPQHLAVLSLHHFFQIVAHVRTMKHRPGVIFVFQNLTSRKFG